MKWTLVDLPLQVIVDRGDPRFLEARGCCTICVVLASNSHELPFYRRCFLFTIFDLVTMVAWLIWTEQFVEHAVHNNITQQQKGERKHWWDASVLWYPS